MKYMGSKSRIAKEIVPIIQDHIDKNNIKTYIDPFCGGCNVIDKVKCDIKIASDNHKYLIEMFKNLSQIQNLPDFITKEEYSNVRDCFNDSQTTYEVLDELAKKWRCFDDKEDAYYQERFFKRY